MMRQRLIASLMVESLLVEGRALLKDIGGSMGIDLAPFKFEAPDGKYWPKCNMSGPSGPSVLSVIGPFDAL